VTILDELGQHLAPFAFEGIEFPARDISTSFGHDSAQHKGFGQRGADIETTGPKAEGVRVRAVLMNGLRGWTGPKLWPDQYQRLVRALKTTPEGLLTHPTRGVMTVHFDEGSEDIEVQNRRGLVLGLSFTEQNGESELLEMASATDDPGSAMLAAAADVDALAPTDASVTRSLLDETQSALDFIEAETRSFAEVVSTLDALAADVQTRFDDPAAAVVDAHPYRAALYAMQSATLAYRESALGDAPRTYVVPEESSLARIAAHPDVYGNASRQSDLARANRVPDPARVPAGTVLRVVT
jgi:prophage DNA circulation protein